MLLPLISLADVATRQPSSPVAPDNILSLFFSLLTVLVVIMLLAWLWRRLAPSSFRPNNAMRVLSTLHLGGKDKIMLVRVADQVLLLGITGQQISTLASFPVDQFDESELVSPGAPLTFFQLFSRGEKK